MTHPDDTDIELLLPPLGLSTLNVIYTNEYLPVVVNGKIVGYL